MSSDASAPPPVIVSGPVAAPSMVVIAIPHAGRHYPDWLLEAARVPQDVLARLEDRHVDMLAVGLAERGHVVIAAPYARALIDLNRAEHEWDASAVAGGSPRYPVPARVRSGLGLLPTRLSGVGELWRTRTPHAALEARLATYYRPYHGAIAAALAAAKARHGRAILIDLHSMPQQAGGIPHLVVGDRHGATAPLQLVDAMLAAGEGHGLIVNRNAPYAGAHSILHHAAPKRGVHAVQIEFDRTLYVDAAQRPDPAGVARLRRVVAALVAIAEGYGASAAIWPQAAE